MNNGKDFLIGVKLWSNLRCEIKQTILQSVLPFLISNTIHCSQIMLIIALQHIFLKYASKKDLGQLNSSQLPAIQMSCLNYRNPVDTYCIVWPIGKNDLLFSTTGWEGRAKRKPGWKKCGKWGWYSCWSLDFIYSRPAALDILLSPSHCVPIHKTIKESFTH